MATAEKFEDLSVWKDAREIVREVYRITRDGGFERDFALRDQIRKAAVSTMSNIAEGFERGTRKEFIQFLNIAKASNGEVRSQLYVALDQNYLAAEAADSIKRSLLTLSRRLAKFVSYLEQYPATQRRRKPAELA